MDALIEWGYGVIAALQSARSPLLDAFFSSLSFMGDEEFYLLLIPLLYWLVDKRLATRFALAILLSAYLNMVLKSTIAQPRPSAERVAVLDDPAGGGMPSGHAQNGLAGWGLLAAEVPRRAFRAGVVVLLLAIGLSRLYLGVHFPHDLAAGWLAGAALLGAFLLVAPRASAWHAAQPLAVQSAVPALIVLVMALLSPIHEATTAAATLFGMGIGVPLERRLVRFRERGAGAARIAGRLLLGFLVALLIWRGLKPLLDPLDTLGTLVRYGLLGAWVSALGPWLFVRLGLAHREG